jgi:hypothetical protein
MAHVLLSGSVFTCMLHAMFYLLAERFWERNVPDREQPNATHDLPPGTDRRGMPAQYMTGAEAQVGGPIALVRDGDRVVIDAETRAIDVPDVSAAEFAHRKSVPKAPHARAHAYTRSAAPRTLARTTHTHTSHTLRKTLRARAHTNRQSYPCGCVCTHCSHTLAPPAPTHHPPHSPADAACSTRNHACGM